MTDNGRHLRALRRLRDATEQAVLRERDPGLRARARAEWNALCWAVDVLTEASKLVTL